MTAPSDLGDSITLLMRDVDRVPRLTLTQEVALAKRIEAGDLAAKQRMVEAHVRFVLYMARKVRADHVPIVDLVQEGVIGLMHAADKFDYRKGYRFSSYAAWWVRDAFQRALDRNSQIVHIPSRVAQRQRTLARARRDLAGRLGHPPTSFELAEHTELSLADIEFLDAADIGSISIDVAQDAEARNESLSDAGQQVLEALADDPLNGPFEQALAAARAGLTRRTLERLSDAERKVIQLRLGFAGRSIARAELPEALGMTVEEAAATERCAIKALRSLIDAQSLREAA